MKRNVFLFCTGKEPFLILLTNDFIEIGTSNFDTLI